MSKETLALIRHAARASNPTPTTVPVVVLGHIPLGLVGLLIAVILCAAMSSVASELIALGATTTNDFYLRIQRARGRPAKDSAQDLRISKAATILWGGLAIGFASAATLFDNLIEAVNILGSIFYGTILGLFVVAFFIRWVAATPVLIAALIAQGFVVALFLFSDLGFLWWNVIGSVTVVVISIVLQAIFRAPARRDT